jgi:aprataxin
MEENATEKSPSPSRNRNAFSELMFAKKPTPKQPKQVRTTAHTNPNDPRNALLRYVLNPESFPSSLVIGYTDHTVLIRDAYPKSVIHLLLLPRDPSKYNFHPHTAFSDPAFLRLIRSEAETAVQLAASELSRLLSPNSKLSQARLKAMESPDPPTGLPAGRDFLKELKIGIHAHPSMNHLHVHIISPDMSVPSMKHRKHYNSFNTEFFIPLADFPLSDDDPRKQVAYQNDQLRMDFKCWRCGEMFGNKFKQLKEHMAVEFEEWKKE